MICLHCWTLRGAAAYITKESTSEQLVAAIHKGVSVGALISPAVAEQYALNSMPGTDNQAPHKALSLALLVRRRSALHVVVDKVIPSERQQPAFGGMVNGLPANNFLAHDRTVLFDLVAKVCLRSMGAGHQHLRNAVKCVADARACCL